MKTGKEDWKESFARKAIVRQKKEKTLVCCHFEKREREGGRGATIS